MFRHGVTFPIEKMMSGPIVMAMVVIDTKTPRSATSLKTNTLNQYLLSHLSLLIFLLYSPRFTDIC